jgi:CDP-paratose 2-epimerase
MKKQTILITGGAGFVGSNLAILLKQSNEDTRVICLDNLKRRGSELNLNRLKEYGIEFIHGDIRVKEDLLTLPKIDTLLECSAEPSVLAGVGGSPDYLIQTNLVGTINCLELARRDGANVIFLSTSRIYPMKHINTLEYTETATRFELTDNQKIPGASSKGYSEMFPLDGYRSLYGATKLASELILSEYIDTYKIKGIINRCGVLCGPWQMGKVDQGIIVFWAANHIYNKPLAYFGYGGEGKQVRDILHVKDLYRLIEIQLSKMDSLNGEVFNVGGGREVSVSLNELTSLCERYSKNKVDIKKVVEDRANDIRIYLTDNTKVTSATGWKPTITAESIMEEIIHWIMDNKELLKPILG